MSAAALGISSLVAISAPASAAPITDPTAAQNTCAADLVGVGTLTHTVAAGFSTPHPVDGNVNVYVGGDFTSTKGAELEGRLVVNGNATVGSDGLGNLVAVGAGSGLTPEPGSTFVRVGGDFTVDKPVQIFTWTSESDVTHASGVVKVGGEIHDESNIDGDGNTIESSLGHDNALGGYSSWDDGDFAQLSTLAQNDWSAGTDGTSELASSILTLNGSPSATYHRFTVDSSDLAAGVELNIGDNISPTDPIVIKVTGDPAAEVKVQGVQDNGTQLVMGNERFGQLASQILWVFPDQTDVTIAGAQFPGSIIVLNSESTTTVAAAGTNGRVWVAGDLVQNRGGTEFHAFPFIGDDQLICSPDDPSDPGSEDPSDPGSEDPSDPGTEDPSDPGTEDPSDPGTEDPSDPGTESPTDPGTEDPTDVGGDNDSTDPGDNADDTSNSGDDTATGGSAVTGEDADAADQGDGESLADTGSALSLLPIGAAVLALLGVSLIAVRIRPRRN